MSSADLETLLRPLARAIAEELAPIVADRLRADRFAGLVDQASSPLGRRKHIALARKVGSQVGRRFFLSEEQIKAALAKCRPATRRGSSDEVERAFK